MALSASSPSNHAAAVLGANLQRLRSARSMTQAEAAERAGIARAHYGALEMGSSSNGGPANPRLSTLLNLAHAFNTSIGDLLLNIEPAPPSDETTK